MRFCDVGAPNGEFPVGLYLEASISLEVGIFIRTEDFGMEKRSPVPEDLHNPPAFTCPHPPFAGSRPLLPEYPMLPLGPPANLAQSHSTSQTENPSDSS